MKSKTIDGKVYRCRRGKWVEISPEWVGKFTTDSTKKKRRKEGRSFNTGSSQIPVRSAAPATGEDLRAAPGHRASWRRDRKMMPEPVVSRRDRDRALIAEELEGDEHWTRTTDPGHSPVGRPIDEEER
jgi:hypothetical protein